MAERSGVGGWTFTAPAAGYYRFNFSSGATVSHYLGWGESLHIGLEPLSIERVSLAVETLDNHLIEDIKDGYRQINLF